ncbi:uncharacterized protein LOC133830295 [Humulus lupulus]|uniref:uncharacterized protein LOC133830295 n=1 Tax=Humulus lupulus TaxID=3486 RepID=UPI002B400D08|nr:uncharacterized protein LOC133830295 [Humulus lupulus]
MLLTPSTEDDNTWNMYNVTNNKFLESKLVVPYDKRFCASSKGWVVTVNKDWTVTLYKPCSMVQYGNNNANTCVIQLPPLFPMEYEEGVEPYDLENDVRDDYDVYIDPENVYHFHIYKALITHDPLANPDECIVVVIFSDINELAFIRLSHDDGVPQTWIKIEPNFFSEDILLYNDLFYAVTGDGDLRSFDLRGSCVNSTVKKLAREIPWMFQSGKRYLVESYGHIIMVERFIEFEDVKIKGRTTLSFRVWRYCFDSDDWIQIKNLGQMSLFVGDNSSLSILASSFMGLQPNCIYFTHDVDGLYGSSRPPMISDLGLYNLENEEFKLHFTIDSDKLKKMNYRPPIGLFTLSQIFGRKTK